jgi:hypothetical protein
MKMGVVKVNWTISDKSISKWRKKTISFQLKLVNSSKSVVKNRKTRKNMLRISIKKASVGGRK